MTAFSMQYAPDAITISSDTLAYLPDRTDVKPLGFMNKVLPLHHLRAVIFSRGQYSITVGAVGEILLRWGLDTIEAVALELPDILRTLTHRYCDMYGIDDPGTINLLDLVLAGWSEQEQRMRVWHFVNQENYALSTEADRQYGLHAIPQLAPQFQPKLPDTLSAVQRTAAVVGAIGLQFATDPEFRNLRIGGDIVATTITPKGISQETVVRLKNYDQDAVASAAIRARIERGDLDVVAAVQDGLYRLDDMAAADMQPAAKSVHAMTRQQRRAAEKMARKGKRAA